MLNIDDEVTGQISKIHQPYSSVINNDPNNALVTISDSMKRSFTVGFEIETGAVLDRILETGDLLIKKYGQEELLILRIVNNDTLIFRFELTDNLGYPLKKKNHDNP